ncbi:hypothetical protein TNCV_5096761 [Trichonephila clavipes]|nr:hypothetical protein TNCV_5096761 [Trichonephila clavipes]
MTLSFKVYIGLPGWAWRHAGFEWYIHSILLQSFLMVSGGLSVNLSVIQEQMLSMVDKSTDHVGQDNNRLPSNSDISKRLANEAARIWPQLTINYSYQIMDSSASHCLNLDVIKEVLQRMIHKEAYSFDEL